MRSCRYQTSGVDLRETRPLKVDILESPLSSQRQMRGACSYCCVINDE